MDTLLWILLCGAVALVSGSELETESEVCDSDQYTTRGECCMECPPGEGVVKKCGSTQTVCRQCLDSETYSDSYSHTEECQKCTECEGLMRMKTPCTDSNDAVCVCNYGYYMNTVTDRCEMCTVCPPGEGVLSQCVHEHDTVCERCEDDMFSDQASALDPCLPCTTCDGETDILLRECTPTADAVCHDPMAPTFSPELESPTASWVEVELPRSPGPDEETTTARPSTPRFILKGFSENLIPIYCFILATVVVSLLIYFVVKRWNSCKQNKQAANNRAAAAAAATANQTPSPEGEKLHSDSGISVDSQSLQEQQQHAQTGQHSQAEAHTQAHTQLHMPEQIVVSVDGGAQPDSPPPQA